MTRLDIFFLRCANLSKFDLYHTPRKLYDAGERLLDIGVPVEDLGDDADERPPKLGHDQPCALAAHHAVGLKPLQALEVCGEGAKVAPVSGGDDVQIDGQIAQQPLDDLAAQPVPLRSRGQQRC
ncbi:hypothetical protein [Caulobacter sp. LjRoot300]|uniref:hypothetical protein n=1 Tax=Caulobacter sp. LjRoot300 TaxID=3342321 RepID=UPI003ED0EED3